MISFFIAVGTWTKLCGWAKWRMEGLQASKSMLFLASGKERKGDYWTVQLTTLRSCAMHRPAAARKRTAELAPTEEVFGIQLVLQLMSLELPEWPVIKWAPTAMMTVWNPRRWASSFCKFFSHLIFPMFFFPYGKNFPASVPDQKQSINKYPLRVCLLPGVVWR